MSEEVKKEEESTKIAEEPGTSCCDHAEEDVGEEKIILGEVLDDKKNVVRIAVAGCSHGEMDKIYGALEEIVKETGKPFDLLICCGDFQAVRNYGDLDHMHVPDKFKSLQTFYKYYSREKVAPILTLFVGGNHEASGYLSELPHGGWVAPRIYYMGFSNVIRFAGLRIAGLSGIFKNFDFDKGHFERPPFQRDSLISAYHVRKFDIWRLEQLRGPDKENNKVDIMISHDWPSGITDYGNVDRLLRIKPFFRDDIASGNLGNPATMQLLYDIRPRYWLAAHLHVMFPALVPHQNTEGTPVAQPTKFLALDKPIPRRHFLQALEIEIDENAEKVLQYDAEWLAILRATDAFVNCNPEKIRVPPQNSSRKDFRPTSEELEAISQLGSLDIPTDFYQTAPPITDLNDMRIYDAPSSLYYKLWDHRTMAIAQKFPKKNNIQLHCDWTSDGLQIITCNNGFNGTGSEISVWDLRSGKLMRDMKGHDASVTCVSYFSQQELHNKRLVISCSRDKTARIWNIEDGSCLWVEDMSTGGELLQCSAVGHQYAVITGSDGFMANMRIKYMAGKPFFQFHAVRRIEY